MGRSVLSVAKHLALYIVVVGVVGLPAMPAASAAPSGSEPDFGVQFHATWGDYSDAERIEVLDMLADAGVKWIRIDIGWTSLQETGPDRYASWQTKLLDLVVDGARERGMKVLGTFWLTPDWANDGAGSRKPPDDPADYARAARWIAERFEGRVDAWEVWNEPNLDSFWEGSKAEYVELLQAAYPAFKAGDPDAEVLLGGVAYNDTDWLEDAYDLGIGGYFDVMNTHPYMSPADLPPEAPDNGDIWRMDHVGAVKELMEVNGDGDKPIWFTEFGWSSHANWNGVPNWHRGVTEQQQADYAVRSLEFLAGNHPYVDNVFWYNERNRHTGGVQLDNYGILYRDLDPKPVYDALKDHLTGTSGSPQEPDGPEVPEIPDAPEETETPDVEVPDETESPEVPDDPEEPGVPAAPTTPYPTTPPVDDGSDGNLLSNGDFEDGLAPWTAARGRARVVSTTAATGKRSTHVTSRGRVRALRSEQIALSDSTTVEASGYLRVPRPGQRIRMVLVERRSGRVVSRRVITLRVWSRDWVKAPTVYYGTRGDSRLTVLLKMKSREGRHFWADGLRLERV